MPVKEEMVALKRPFFPKHYADFVQKLRVASGFVLLFSFAWFTNPSPLSLAAGLPVACFGLLIRSWAAGHLAKNEQLATTGPFAYVRNPLYAGTLLTALGIVIMSRSFVLGILFTLVFCLVYLPVIELEEQHLRSLFPAYSDYAGRVRRFVPGRRWPGRRVGISARLWTRNQEWKALAGFALALIWIAWRLWLRAAVT